MKKGYCVDCNRITLIKAKNRCESHYRCLYYKQHREKELAYQRAAREVKRKSREEARTQKMQSTTYGKAEMGGLDRHLTRECPEKFEQ